jgi:hypothetical protein
LKTSDILIDDMPLIARLGIRHFLVYESTDMGKTQFISKFLKSFMQKRRYSSYLSHRNCIYF